MLKLDLSKRNWNLNQKFYVRKVKSKKSQKYKKGSEKKVASEIKK